jgi:hypothetical protein
LENVVLIFFPISLLVCQLILSVGRLEWL